MKKRILSLFPGIFLCGLVFAQNNDTHIQPQFKIGDFQQFIAMNTKYPEQARDSCITGVAIVQFVIDTVGNVDSVHLSHSVHPLLGKEAIRVITLSSGHWIPGKVNGKPVRVTFTFPLKFSLHNEGCLDYDYYYNLGVEYYNQGKIEMALSSFLAAIKLNPHDVDALINISLIKINQNDFQSACQYLNEIKSTGKPDADALLLKYCK